MRGTDFPTFEGGGGGGKFCDSLSDAYVKFDIKEQEPHYHYPNLDSLSNV